VTVFIGVDPGAVTGLCRYDTATGPRGPLISDALTFLDACRWLDGAITLHRPDVVVAVERFTIGGSRPQTSQPDALEIIGVCRYLCARDDVRLIVQGASVAGGARGAGSPDVLRRVGWWIPADPDQHRNRAAAQVALALLTSQPSVWYDVLESGRVDTSDLVFDTTVDGER